MSINKTKPIKQQRSPVGVYSQQTLQTDDFTLVTCQSQNNTANSVANTILCLKQKQHS